MADSQTATSAPEFKSAHFIGIGGAGMSGIALVLHERGYAVTGSDLKTSRYIRQLTRAGVEVHVGHEAATIDEVKPDVVVVSTAIPESNPELVRARELGIPVWPRAKMLSALGHGYTTVAVAGTHGKTTTSSMCATMLDRMGLDPSFLIGGIVEGYDTNGKNGSGDYFVAEADGPASGRARQVDGPSRAFLRLCREQRHRLRAPGCQGHPERLYRSL